MGNAIAFLLIGFLLKQQFCRVRLFKIVMAGIVNAYS